MSTITELRLLNALAEVEALRATNGDLYAELEAAHGLIAYLTAQVEAKEDALQFERNQSQIWRWLHELDIDAAVWPV